MLAALDEVLEANGIERRVIGGRLRINPTRGPVSGADRELIRFYADDLARWLEGAHGAGLVSDDDPAVITAIDTFVALYAKGVTAT
ncbi:hypothetical protein [Botrimarina sp.]|uniref:hypothetical protein n=1 Tax=Botrimarina sp. TaxID=2795802 RepID=UPI0032EDCFF2